MNNIFLKRREAIDKVIICAIIKIEKSFFHLSQMVLEAPNGKLSTTYLDQQLKNKNSSWYKEYSFIEMMRQLQILTITLILNQKIKTV